MKLFLLVPLAILSLVVITGCQTARGPGFAVQTLEAAPVSSVNNASPIRWAVVNLNPEDGHAIQATSLLSDNLVGEGCQLVDTAGFKHLESEIRELLQLTSPPSAGNFLRYGVDMVLVIQSSNPLRQPHGDALRIRAWNMCGEQPMLDRMVFCSNQSSGQIDAGSIDSVRGMVKDLLARANMTFQRDEFEVQFRGLNSSTEDILEKLLHTLPEVRETILLTRVNPVGQDSESISRWKIRVFNLSNVHLIDRINNTVQEAVNHRKLVLDQRTMAISDEEINALTQIQVLASSPRLLVFCRDAGQIISASPAREVTLTKMPATASRPRSVVNTPPATADENDSGRLAHTSPIPAQPEDPRPWPYLRPMRLSQ